MSDVKIDIRQLKAICHEQQSFKTRNHAWLDAVEHDLPRLLDWIDRATPWLVQANNVLTMPNTKGKPYPDLEKLIKEVI